MVTTTAPYLHKSYIQHEYLNIYRVYNLIYKIIENK